MTIKQVQSLLTYLGYDPGEVDGVSGVKTIAAVEAFQSAEGLRVDGIAGASTAEKLLDAVEKGHFCADTGKTSSTTKSDTSDTKSDTGSFWDSVKYFSRAEFKCQCKGKYCNGFPVEPQERIVRICEEIRERLGVPITIVESGGSGVRCKQHNAEVGGAANSYHMLGRAADLHSSASPEKMKEVAEAVTAELCPGAGGIGIYKWGIHVDDGAYSRWDLRG